jgi:hypothetical protein
MAAVFGEIPPYLEKDWMVRVRWTLTERARAYNFAYSPLFYEG